MSPTYISIFRSLISWLRGTNLTFLGTIEEGSVLWSITNLDDLSTCEQLHDEARCHDGRDTQFHQRTWAQIQHINQTCFSFFNVFMIALECDADSMKFPISKSIEGPLLMKKIYDSVHVMFSISKICLNMS